MKNEILKDYWNILIYYLNTKIKKDGIFIYNRDRELGPATCKNSFTPRIPRAELSNRARGAFVSGKCHQHQKVLKFCFILK